MQMYRVLYEKRRKPLCSCCDPDDPTHAWTTHGTEATHDLSAAERDERKAWDWHGETEEVRNVRIETAEIEWNEYR